MELVAPTTQKKNANAPLDKMFMGAKQGINTSILHHEGIPVVSSSNIM